MRLLRTARIHLHTPSFIGATCAIAAIATFQATVPASVLAQSSEVRAKQIAKSALASQPPRAQLDVLSDPAVDGEWSLLQPQARCFHTAIYDPDGDRLLIFGGWFNDVWQFSLKTWFWSALATSGIRPSARIEHPAIYDPIRKRMVIFGGYDGSYLNDTWALSLQDSTWTQLSTSGGPPSARVEHTAIYDPVRDRMVVFGGCCGYRNDTWALSFQDSTWTQLSTSGGPPSARCEHTAIYDPVGDRMVVFGGYRGSHPYLNDTWALSFQDSTWTELSCSGGPSSGRRFHRAIYDPIRKRMVVFGGDDGSYLGDTWALSLQGSCSWTSLLSGGISARRAHTLVYDSLRDEMVVFGGDDGSSRLNDTWKAEVGAPTRWERVSPWWPPPSGRTRHTSIYDPVGDLMVVFGGNDGSYRNDVWTLRHAGMPRWTQLATSGAQPGGRNDHSAIYDPIFRRMVVFGGYSGFRRNDTWVLSLQDNSWTQLPTSGPLPSARYGHTAIYDPLRYRMLVFGGYCGSYQNDTWALGLFSSGWAQIDTACPEGCPPGRYQHSAIYDPVGDRMVVFGGYSASTGRLDDVWALYLGMNPPTWLRIDNPYWPKPLARLGHTAIYDPIDENRRMVVFGGDTSADLKNDLWEFSLCPVAPCSWTQLNPSGSWPTPRSEHAAVFRPRQGPLRGRMLVFGGGTTVGRQNDVAALTWIEPGVTSAPPAGVAARFFLHQNRPNPFNPATMISFELPVVSSVRLQLLDVAGRLVRELVRQEMGPGTHTVHWDGRDEHGGRVASGVYVYRIEAGSFRESRKLVVLR